MKYGIIDSTRHNRFATVSRDYNPIHMDAVAARRSQVGAPIVHGMHSLMRLLESTISNEACLPRIVSLKAQFRNPTYIGDVGDVEIVQRNSRSLQARLLVNGGETLVCRVGFEKHREVTITPRLHENPVAPPAHPNELLIEQLSRRAGLLEFASTITGVQSIFPLLAHHLGARRVAALVSLSCLVGMVIPGLHSLFTGLDLGFSDDLAIDTDSLHHSVTSVDARFRLIRIAVDGGGLFGSLEAVSRMPPVRQPPMDRVAAHVLKDEFRATTALVIGGSRGLGELTAKIISAGGGRVVITYASGRVDGDRVAQEIRCNGAECELMAYDARRPAGEQLEFLGSQAPPQIYYFATPLIARRKGALFDPILFAEFNSFYVNGFFDLVMESLRRNPTGIRVFYPSSEAIATRPESMTEYAMSKSAAEILCIDMQKYLPSGVHVVMRRLPRLPTDQTNSLLEVEIGDPIGVMLSVVREMNAGM
jgi:acyl dehydratase